ncbi:hypothetical protein B0T24DRAFT_207526 [Lasiosphaeria ovina]|uniref:Uncharacterized protein n=1 Tax=Lasiosphaeria ovina TaxID=92902 RepID=A0AAE0NA44_9PEZI|nr:hypothetical protein B0T24DRAFT_207526 [Lasiosphaeria ovina]
MPRTAAMPDTRLSGAITAISCSCVNPSQHEQDQLRGQHSISFDWTGLHWTALDGGSRWLLVSSREWHYGDAVLQIPGTEGGSTSTLPSSLTLTVFHPSHQPNTLVLVLLTYSIQCFNGQGALQKSPVECTQARRRGFLPGRLVSDSGCGRQVASTVERSLRRTTERSRSGTLVESSELS